MLTNMRIASFYTVFNTGIVSTGLILQDTDCS